MLRFIFIIGIFANIIYSQLRLAEVSGTVFLSDQTNDHSGVKIKFESVSSSGTTDSTISNIDGSYSIGLNDGIYVINYSKSGYIPYTLPGSFSYAGGSYVLDDITLNAGSIIEVSGKVEGTFYNDYQYRVVGNIEIERGDTLFVEPGTSVLFMGSFGLDVYGSLIAVGTEQDSIYFNSGAAQPSRGDWENIHIKSSQNCDDATSRVVSFQYCNINYGGGNGYYGVIFDESAFSERDHTNCIAQLPFVNVLNSRVTNSADKLIFSVNSKIHVENTLLSGYNEYPLNLENTNAEIISNQIIWDGGGEWSPLFYISLYNNGSNKSRKVEIKNNFFKTKKAVGRLYNEQNESSHKDSVIITGNSFTSFEQIYDFYIRTWYNHYTLIEKNIFVVEDDKDRSSSIFTLQSNDESIIRNNTIKHVYGAFNHYANAKTTIENNIVVDAYSIFNPSGSASSSIIQNNIFYEYDNFIYNNNQNFFSVGFGDILTVNSNGDSIDTYSNLFINPKFAPSDSTVIYGWTLSQNGNLEFVANPYVDYYASHIGNPSSGSVQFYSNENGWTQGFPFQQESELWSTNIDFYELYPDGGYPIQMDISFSGDQGYRSQYIYGLDIIGNSELTEYQAYSNFISENSPALDAGNPDPLLYDPDGTISDIGANYYHQGDQGSISAPIADFSSSSVEGSYPLYVEFTSISSGAVNEYTWNFGDGYTSNSRRPVHLYTAAGTYSVSLTVTGPGGVDTVVKIDFINVAAPSLPPVISFSAEPTAGVLPLEVVFSSSIVNDAESVLWNFGDGATSAELNPTHTYDATGSYTVSLTAANSYGNDVETKNNFINVIGPEEVIAGFDAAPRIGIAPMEVSFINESVGTIDSILWDFGNGSGVVQLSPIYTYDQPGKYDVSMIAYGLLNNDTIQEFDFVDIYDKRPIISSVVDIPNDQGGQVLLRWNPSGWDGPVGNKITQYSLWEDYNGEWININNAMASQNDSYTFLANTFADSNSESVNWSKFKVLAHTNDPGVFYESPVDSGFSIDNVPPSTPSAILATISSNGIDLEWGEVNESNFMFYNLYRNGEKIAELTNRVYTDFNLGTQTPSYYQVAAVDDGGNESELTPETIVDATDLAWFINIRGSMIGGESDLFNFIGTSEDATADFDEGYDIFEPPLPPANFLAISFPIEGLETILGDELAQDVHKDIVLTDTMHVWHMNAISNVSDSAIFYFDMTNVPDVPIIVEHIGSGQRAYLSDSSWFGFGMIADSLYQFKISIGDTTSPVLAMHQNVNGPRILHSDSSYVFSWDITDGNGLDSVFAYASSDSGYSYNLISSWSGQIDTLIYTIPDTTIATGCLIQIHGRDYAGNHITKQSDQVFTIVGDSLSVFVGSGWNLWGVPMVPYIGNMIDNLEEEINGYWYAYGFEEGGYTFDSTLSIGQGYWLATLDDANIEIHGMPLSEEYNQNLNLGWNIISNPLVLDVSVDSLTFDKDSEVLGFSDALDAGWINSIYSYDNLGYEMPSILKSWTGYWISVLDSGISVTYPMHKGVESNQPVRMVRNESSWNIAFEAAIDGAIDRLTVMGVAEDATNGFDPAYDIAEAPNPPGGEYVTMSTYHQDWPTILGEKYSKDVKSPIINGAYNEWVFTIEASSDEIEITWLFENIPDEYQIGYNYTDGMFFADMRAIESLIIPNGSELIIRVGAELLALESSDLLPQFYSLHQNYPNPFNPTTSISYDLPANEFVIINVFDLMGREVKTLVNKNQVAGFRSVQWNATNNLGQPVSAGMYIYTIQAGEFRQTRKMVLLK